VTERVKKRHEHQGEKIMGVELPNMLVFAACVSIRNSVSLVTGLPGRHVESLGCSRQSRTFRKPVAQPINLQWQLVDKPHDGPRR
jgi:hypothetical protein